MMRADLHLHTLCSDGAYPPAEIARRCKEAGVVLFSLTDHDSMSGLAEGAETAKALGLRFVRGMEISAYVGATKVHILGYGCEEGETYFRFLQQRITGARLRAEDAVKKANAALGLDVSMEEAERFHLRKDAPLHTMHVLDAFASRLGTDRDTLYRELFVPGAPAFSELGRPLPDEAVRLIHEMGGVAVLAHPAQILVLPAEISKRYRLLSHGEKEEAKRAFAGNRNAMMERLAANGLDGIECYHSTHTLSETEEFLAFARAHGLFVTGGSDFHSDDSRRRVGTPAFDASEIAELLLSLKGSV